MSPASELEEVTPCLFIWQRYDPAVKAELCSTAILTDSGIHLVDPIPISRDALQPLWERARVEGVIVTNANHERAAADFAKSFQVPIFRGSGALNSAVTGETGRSEERASSQAGAGASSSLKEIAFIPIEGAAAGETALYLEAEGGTLIMGDALINMGSQGFTFLPAKYCTNQKLMRKSLRQLLQYPCERILFAHGLPIVSRAAARLRDLLNGSA